MPMLWTALAAGAIAAALNPVLRRLFTTEARLARWWLQVPIAVVLGAAAGLAASLVEQVTFTLLAVAAALLMVVDFGEYRLPDVIVLPSYGVLAVGLTIAAAEQGRWFALGRAGVTAVAMFVLYFVMAMFAPDLGFGDVKLAGAVGGFLGWFGVAAALAGFLLAWVMMALVGLVMIALRRIGAKASLPFGPYLILGAVLAVFVGPMMFPAFA